MGKLNIGRILDCFNPNSSRSSSCFCMNYSMENQEEDYEFESKPLIAATEKDKLLRLKDVVNGNQTLAFQLKPKMVMLKVSMHCKGCARKVEKHISKMEGVTSYRVDLETKMVMIIGDIVPFEVLESISKVKNAQLWQSSPPSSPLYEGRKKI